MLTRRKLIVNGLPAALATAGVGVNLEANAESTTDELLAWARDRECYVEIYADGSAMVQWNFTLIDYDFIYGDTLREALLAAKAEIEKQVL